MQCHQGECTWDLVEMTYRKTGTLTALTRYRSSDLTLPPRYILPFVFPLRALLHITLLVVPCPPLGDAHSFLSYSYLVPRTSV